MRTAARPNQTTTRNDLRKVDIREKNYYLTDMNRETSDLCAIVTG
jgi:hypothetical protein